MSAQRDVPPEHEPRSRGKAATAIRAVIGLALVFCAVLALVYLKQVQTALTGFLDWVRGTGPLGMFYFGLVYVAATVLFVPGLILTMGSGFAFGVGWGTVVVSLASVTGASGAFFLGRTLLRDWVERKVQANPRFRAIDAAVGQQGFKIVLLTRLSPVFPFNLLNYAFGVTRVSYVHYLLASWIGMLPGTVMYVYLGSAVQDVARLLAPEPDQQTTPGQWVLRGVGLLATIAVTVLITRVARRALAEQVPLDTANHEPAAAAARNPSESSDD